jgi:hypothetical protein
MSQSMRSVRRQTNFPAGLQNVLANDVLRERRAVVETEHARALQMTMGRHHQFDRRENWGVSISPSSATEGTAQRAPPRFRSELPQAVREARG